MPEHEGQVNEKKITLPTFKNPFCGSPAQIKHPLLNNRKAWKIVGADVDKKTLSTRPVFEEYDSQEKIQECEKLCGMEYMKMLLKTGQASVEDFYDDGKSGIDTTVFPENVHEAKKKAEELNKEISKIAEEVGAKEGQNYSAEQLEDLLVAAIKEKFASINTQTNTANADGESK